MTESGVVFGLFGAVEHPLQGQPISKASGQVLSDVFLIAAIAVGLLLILLIWARYLRNLKLRKPRKGGERVYRDPDELAEHQAEEAAKEAAAAESRRKYKYRYRRRDHRARNPTLAETGGLPPERTEGPGEPTH